jgi:hypothetical protein
MPHARTQVCRLFLPFVVSLLRTPKKKGHTRRQTHARDLAGWELTLALGELMTVVQAQRTLVAIKAVDKPWVAGGTPWLVAQAREGPECVVARRVHAAVVRSPGALVRVPALVGAVDPPLEPGVARAGEASLYI